VRNGLPILIKPKKHWVSGLYADRLAPPCNEWHPYLSMMNGNPAWWDLVVHTRRQRAASKRLEHSVLRGSDPDTVVWPVNHKPHIYYW